MHGISDVRWWCHETSCPIHWWCRWRCNYQCCLAGSRKDISLSSFSPGFLVPVCRNSKGSQTLRVLSNRIRCLLSATLSCVLCCLSTRGRQHHLESTVARPVVQAAPAAPTSFLRWFLHLSFLVRSWVSHVGKMCPFVTGQCERAPGGFLGLRGQKCRGHIRWQLRWFQVVAAP